VPEGKAAEAGAGQQGRGKRGTAELMGLKLRVHVEHLLVALLVRDAGRIAGSRIDNSVNI
jgi:hypothetical protein